jgi:hypothetical protein
MSRKLRPGERCPPDAYILKKDIIIPAGTIFSEAPERLELARGHIDLIIGLTNDSHGHLIYDLDPLDDGLAEWWDRCPADGEALPFGRGRRSRGGDA